MIRSRGIEEKMRRQRADAKTLDNLFRRRTEVGGGVGRDIHDCFQKNSVCS
jgi:hypothetical protein